MRGSWTHPESRGAAFRPCSYLLVFSVSILFVPRSFCRTSPSQALASSQAMAQLDKGRAIPNKGTGSPILTDAVAGRAWGMRRARSLAPWQREDPAGEIVEMDAMTAEALAALQGKPAIYHCISRGVYRERVFGPAQKEKFGQLMRLYERFWEPRNSSTTTFGSPLNGSVPIEEAARGGFAT